MADKTKRVSAYAVVDWKKGNVRTRQTKPDASDLRTNELVSKVEFEVTIPDVDVPTASAALAVPEPMVFSALAEVLDDRTRPEFAGVADEIVAGRLDDIRNADADDLDDVVAGIVVATLRKTRGRPDVADVERHVEGVVGEVRSSDA